MEICEYSSFDENEIMPLYASVGWTNYTDRPDMVRMAYENSLCILGAYIEKQLVGIIRAVGDGASIVLIQDILILPEYQHQGIGTLLMKELLNRYRFVYQLELMTDNVPETVAFYKSLGFSAADECGCRAFIRM